MIFSTLIFLITIITQCNLTNPLFDFSCLFCLFKPGLHLCKYLWGIVNMLQSFYHLCVGFLTNMKLFTPSFWYTMAADCDHDHSSQGVSFIHHFLLKPVSKKTKTKNIFTSSSLSAVFNGFPQCLKPALYFSTNPFCHDLPPGTSENIQITHFKGPLSKGLWKIAF